MKLQTRFAVLAVLLALLFSAVFLEIYARLLPGFTPKWTRDRQWLAAFALERDGTHHFVPGIGTVLFPNVNRRLVAHPDFDFTYKTLPLGDEAIGVRDVSIPSNPWAVVLGDSFMEGYGVEQEELWPSLFERETGKDILNLGQSGFTTNQYRALLDRSRKWVTPKNIIVCVFYNDFEERLALPSLDKLDPVSAGMWNIRSPSQYWNFWLLKNSFVYRILRAPDIIYREARDARASRNEKSLIPRTIVHEEPGLELVLQFQLRPDSQEVAGHNAADDEWKKIRGFMDADIRGIQELAKKMGSGLAVLYLPSKEQAYAHLIQKDYRLSADINERNAIVRDICKGLSIPFLDLTDTFRAPAQKGEQLYWRLDGHWNPRGHALAESAIRKWLGEIGWQI